jgi:histidinol-phosphate/aromatic aminotransferase/cobyric acid decarboxylase-like protein
MIRAFDKNDYGVIYNRYFASMVADGSLIADPSGWAKTESDCRFAPPPVPQARVLTDYLIDNRTHLLAEKETIVRLLSEWDQRKYGADEVTLTPSSSSANLAVLPLLQKHGVRSIFFDTPAYYATIDQTEMFGMRAHPVPSYHANGYAWALPDLPTKRRRPVAIWLTQPRFCLGDNQTCSDLSKLARQLTERDFLVFDETAEQQWPSALSAFGFGDSDGPCVIKIRGLTKPLGLNGIRLATIIHPARHRPTLQDYQWKVGAVLDWYSLACMLKIASRKDKFRSMLAAARSRVSRTHARLSAIAEGSDLTLSSMENGYLGSVALDWPRIVGGYAQKRHRLLAYCSDRRVPISLGSAMLFARDPDREHVRLNYFIPATQLECGIYHLIDFTRQTDRRARIHGVVSAAGEHFVRV